MTGIVSKVSLPDTFRRLSRGERITLDAVSHASFSSARAAVYRLNAAKEGEFRITTKDNGCTYVVERLA